MEPMEENSIKKFYDGAEIFITGGSGFVGKALVEKLLRTCSGIKTIYLLMRLKKDASGQQRIQQLTNNLVNKLKLLCNCLNLNFASALQRFAGNSTECYRKASRDRGRRKQDATRDFKA